MKNKRFVFVSTMDGAPWGGSEELWSQTAVRLREVGFPVAASVHDWTPLPNRLAALRTQGIELQLRQRQFPLWRRAVNKVIGHRDLAAHDLERFLCRHAPSLVVISNGIVVPPIQLAEFCVAQAIPYVTIGNGNTEAWWPDDGLAKRYRLALSAAACCYFVSEANWRLAEKQIGGELTNSEVICNPFNVPLDAAPPFPPEGTISFACVGLLYPPVKGQDILLEALAAPVWSTRDWQLTFYGHGPARQGLERLAARLGVTGRVAFAGHVADITGIWARHHALIMPSRYEGMPLAMVEAMLCGRPVIATDVAGHSEIIEDGTTGFLAEAPAVSALQRTLERAWEHRAEFQSMGGVGAARIRQLLPKDPVGVFCEKLKAIADAPR